MTDAKWCDHCQKNTHDDKDCWSTRAIAFIPRRAPPIDFKFKLREGTLSLQRIYGGFE